MHAHARSSHARGHVHAWTGISTFATWTGVDLCALDRLFASANSSAEARRATRSYGETLVRLTHTPQRSGQKRWSPSATPSSVAGSRSRFTIRAGASLPIVRLAAWRSTHSACGLNMRRTTTGSRSACFQRARCMPACMRVRSIARQWQRRCPTTTLSRCSSRRRSSRQHSLPHKVRRGSGA